MTLFTIPRWLLHVLAFADRYLYPIAEDLK